MLSIEGRRSSFRARATMGLAGGLLLLLAGCGGNGDSGSVLAPALAPVSVRIIALNDFHGNIDPPAATNGGSVILPTGGAGTTVRTGGAAYLATLVTQLKAASPNAIVVGAGDIVSAAPTTATLTHQEAAIDVMNAVGLEVSSVGNHEFDQGKTELLRWQNGGCYPGGTVGVDTCLQNGQFSGAKWTYLSANVVDTSTNQTLFPATYVKQFGTGANAVRVGFIGLTLQGTPSVVTATGVAGLNFLDEATTINQYAAQLKQGSAAQPAVDAVVVLIHQGGYTTASTFDDQTCPGLSGEIVPIVDALSSNVDMVVSGHTHEEYDCVRNGKHLTQTGFYGSALSTIDLSIIPGQGVQSVTTKNVPVINDLNTSTPSGYSILPPDAAVASLVQLYDDSTATIQKQQVGTIAADIKRALLADGTNRDETAEGAMGDVMADVYLSGGPQADLAFINPGGVRADLIYANDGNNPNRPADMPNGAVTYGDLLTVAPFGNQLATMDFTYAQLIRLLENQWEAPNCAAKQSPGYYCGRLLQPSAGFTYAYDCAQPVNAPVGSGHRVVAGSLKINGVALDPSNTTKTYRVTVNTFMGPPGGDNFTAVADPAVAATYQNSGVVDLDAFVAYMKNNPGLAPPAPRVQIVNPGACAAPPVAQ